jgi:hypothetical protein
MMMIWYQTKYSLTSGIVEIEGELSNCNKYVMYDNHGFDAVGIEIFATMKEAREDQKTRARKAIENAKKRIAKLEKLLEDNQ